MLRDRYEPMNLFAQIPQLGMPMDPVLAQLDRLLDHDGIFQAVKADLLQRYPRTRTDGRPATPVEVMLRVLVINHWYGWRDEQTEQFVADRLVLRQAGRVYAARVPDATTLIRRARLIQPATLQPLLDQVTDLARHRFLAGHYWRAGIEGRISGLKRRHKLNRCRSHGDAGMHRRVGFGLLAHNLRVIARAIA